MTRRRGWRERNTRAVRLQGHGGIRTWHCRCSTWRADCSRIVRICRDRGGVTRDLGISNGKRLVGYVQAADKKDSLEWAVQSAEADRPMSANGGFHAGRLIVVCRALVPNIVYPRVNSCRNARQSTTTTLFPCHRTIGGRTFVLGLVDVGEIGVNH